MNKYEGYSIEALRSLRRMNASRAKVLAKKLEDIEKEISAINKKFNFQAYFENYQEHKDILYDYEHCLREEAELLFDNHMLNILILVEAVKEGKQEEE
jgi:hypothetical protein